MSPLRPIWLVDTLCVRKKNSCRKVALFRHKSMILYWCISLHMAKPDAGHEKKNERGDDSWRWSTFYFLWFYWICVDLNMVGNEMSTWNLHMLDLKRFQYQILVVLWPFLISHGWTYGCLNNDTEEQKKSLNCIYYWSLTSSNIIHRS